MSVKQAAKLAGISDTRWRQIEQGYRMYRGRREPEPPAPAPILARMASAVRVTPGALRGAGRPDAAGELEALPPHEPEEMTLKEMAARLRHLEELLEGRGNGSNGNGGSHEGNQRDAI